MGTRSDRKVERLLRGILFLRSLLKKGIHLSHGSSPTKMIKMEQKEIPIIGGVAITATAVAATVADKFLNVFGINPDGKWWWERLGTPAKGKFTVEDGHEVYVRPEFPAAIKPEKKRYRVTVRNVPAPSAGSHVVFPSESDHRPPPTPRMEYIPPYPVDDIHV